MLYYSADSVIAELKANDMLKCEGIDDVGCPTPVPSSFTHEERDCPGNSLACKLCSNQSCSQWIIVHSDKYGKDKYGKDKYKKLRTLFFSFLFLNSPRGGRIPKDDSNLDLLIRHKLIDESKLKIC
jgi:hypothetical protein